MDIFSPFEKPFVREKLVVLLKGNNQDGTLQLRGGVADHQITVRAARGLFSLPWRGTFRGALIPLGEGTLVTGKFDSNWALYFVGYPILVGVVFNIAASLIFGYGAGRLPVFTMLIIAAALLCNHLRNRSLKDNRLIIAGMCDAISGRVGGNTE